MKVHFFDKNGNFLKSDEMEESRIRHRLVVPEPLLLELPEPFSVALESTLEKLMMKTRVFGAIPIHPGNGAMEPLFYLYLEVRR